MGKNHVIMLIMFRMVSLECILGECSMSSSAKTLERLSKHLTLKNQRVSILKSLCNHTKELNFNKWSSDIFESESYYSDNIPQTTKTSKDMKTILAGMAVLLSNILKDKAESSIIIITDLQPGNLFLEVLKDALERENIYLDLKIITIDIISMMENLILQSPPNSITLLLLPLDITEIVLQLAKDSYLLGKEKKITWLTFNSDQLQRHYSCIQNIPLDTLFKTVYFDSDCNLHVNKTVTESVANKISQKILECEDNHDEITVTSIIDKPFLHIVIPKVDILGRLVCTNSLICSKPTKLINGTLLWEETCCAGLVIDILREVTLNVHFKIYLSPDGQYGGIDTNGNWTGMINEVYSERADVAIQGITINTPRSLIVDFTDGFMLTTFGIIRRREVLQLSVVNWEFLRTLEFELIYWLGSCFLIILLALFLYENLIYFIFRGKYYPSREAFSYIAGLTFQRDLAGKTPNKWSARLIAIAYAVAMTIFMTTYTANLTANNITKSDTDDFKGMRDKKITNPTPAFTYGLRRGTSNEFYFKNSMQPKLRAVYKTFIKYYLTDSEVEGFDRVSAGNLDAFIGDYVYMRYQLAKPEYCSKLSIYEETQIDFPLGFAVQKNSKWKYLFSEIIRDLQDSGRLQEIINKWFYLPKCLINQAQANKFPWEYIGGMLLAVGVFVFISISVVIFETLYTKRKSKTNAKSINSTKNIKAETMNDTGIQSR